MNIQELEILRRTGEALEQETGRTLRVLETDTRIDKQCVDATVEFAGTEYNVEVKRWVQQANFGALVYQVQQLPGNKLLIADYVNKNLARRLKDAGIQFADTAGNVYMNGDKVYLNIRGNDPLVTLTIDDRENRKARVAIGRDQQIRPVQRQGTGRAFTPTGLRVVYEIIRNMKLVEEPYRQIAKVADVALGTVGWVINDLMAQGVIIERSGHKQIKELEKLIRAWAETYPLKLRPKCLVGRFATTDDLWWKDFPVRDYGAQWGGETGAAVLTAYLRPQIATLYVRGDNFHTDIGRIVQAGRLRRAAREHEANVEILRPFWKQDEPGEIVHPVVIYAELIATADARNLDTATLVYERFLDQLRR